MQFTKIISLLALTTSLSFLTACGGGSHAGAPVKGGSCDTAVVREGIRVFFKRDFVSDLIVRDATSAEKAATASNLSGFAEPINGDEDERYSLSINANAAATSVTYGQTTASPQSVCYVAESGDEDGDEFAIVYSWDRQANGSYADNLVVRNNTFIGEDQQIFSNDSGQALIDDFYWYGYENRNFQ